MHHFCATSHGNAPLCPSPCYTVHNLTGLFALQNSTLLGFARYSSALRYTLLVTLLFSAAPFISLLRSLHCFTMRSFAIAPHCPTKLCSTKLSSSMQLATLLSHGSAKLNSTSLIALCYFAAPVSLSATPRCTTLYKAAPLLFFWGYTVLCFA